MQSASAAQALVMHTRTWRSPNPATDASSGLAQIPGWEPGMTRHSESPPPGVQDESFPGPGLPVAFPALSRVVKHWLREERGGEGGG